MDSLTIWYESGPSFELSQRDAEIELAKLKRRLALTSKADRKKALQWHISAFERALARHRSSSG